MSKAAFDKHNYQRLLPKLAMVVVWATITGALAGILAGGLFYTAYLLLVRHGLDTEVALFVIGISIAIAISISAVLTAAYIRKLRQALQPYSPIASGLYDMASAFMDGLRTTHKNSR